MFPPGLPSVTESLDGINVFVIYTIKRSSEGHTLLRLCKENDFKRTFLFSLQCFDGLVHAGSGINAML